MIGVTCRGKYTLKCKELLNFSTDTPIFLYSNRKSSIVFDECLYGHHIIASTAERYIFRRRKSKSGPYWWLGVTFRGKCTLKCKQLPTFSTEHTIFRYSNGKSSIVFDECLYGRHKVAPTTERYIFQRKKPKSGPYWWLGVTFRGKYTLKCKELLNLSTNTPAFCNSNRTSSTIFDDCLYGHRIDSPSTEWYISHCRKPKFGNFWWHGFTFRSKYNLKCKEVPNFSTDTLFS